MKPARTHTQGVSLVPSPNLLFSEYKTKRGLRGRGAERLLLFFLSLLSFFCLSENQGNKRKGTKKKGKKGKKKLTGSNRIPIPQHGNLAPSTHIHPRHGMPRSTRHGRSSRRSHHRFHIQKRIPEEILFPLLYDDFFPRFYLLPILSKNGV